MSDLWSYEAQTRDLVAWFFDASVSAAEQQRRRRMRDAFAHLVRGIKNDDILPFVAAVDVIGNLISPPRSAEILDMKAYDVVVGQPEQDEESVN